VCQAVRLDGVEALEVEKRLDPPLGRRVSVVYRGDVAADDLRQFRMRGQGFAERAADHFAAHDIAVESRRDAMEYCVLEPAVVKHGCVDEARHRWVGFDDRFRLTADGGPDRIDLA
jgi:hypothetical protein